MDGDGEVGRLPGCPFDFHSAGVSAGVVPPLHHLLVGDFSAPPVHSSFTQNSIFFNPVAFSCLDDKRVTAPDFFKRQEVEVGQVVARQVEVFSNPRVPVVIYSPPVLCATDPAWPCWSDLPDILGWFPQARSSTMGAGDIIDNIGVLAGDGLLYWPRLSSQGAGVGPGVVGIYAAQTSCFATLFETWLGFSTCSLSPVQWGKFCSHQKVP